MQDNISVLIMKYSTILFDELLKLNHPLDIQDSEGNTPLQFAIIRGQTHLALRLLDAGARFDILNEEKKTVRDLAICKNNFTVLAKMHHFHALLDFRHQKIDL
jgi:ankyrin repeat protein